MITGVPEGVPSETLDGSLRAARLSAGSRDAPGLLSLASGLTQRAAPP